MTEAALTTTNWQALLRLKFARGEHRTQLVPLERYGPLSVQRPFYPENDCCHVYLLHPPGGIVGGDTLHLQLALDSGSKSLLTTPGAAKFYVSAGDTARIRQNFQIENSAQLEFLPQENIYFPGALVDSKTVVDVDGDASVILWEKHCLGRPANHETFDSGLVDTQVILNHQGKPVFIDRQRLNAAELNRASGLRSNAVMGNFLVYGTEPDTELVSELQQTCIPGGICAITCPQSNLLVARYLGNSTSEMDFFFVSLWEKLRPQVLGRSACHPRIWKT